MAKTENVNQETGEVTTVSKFDPSKVKAKKILNVPVLSQKGKATIFVTFLSKMFIGKAIAEKEGKDEKKKEPAMIAYVLDLVTGKPFQIIISTVQGGILEESYPDGDYVGKSFQMINHGKLNGKDYNTVEVIEIDAPDFVTPESLAAVRDLIVLPK